MIILLQNRINSLTQHIQTLLIELALWFDSQNPIGLVKNNSLSDCRLPNCISVIILRGRHIRIAARISTEEMIARLDIEKSNIYQLQS